MTKMLKTKSGKIYTQQEYFDLMAWRAEMRYFDEPECLEIIEQWYV